jgi:hypothetical protein
LALTSTISEGRETDPIWSAVEEFGEL